MLTKPKYDKSYCLRMPSSLSDEVFSIAKEQKMTVNALLVSWISKEVQLYNKQKELTTPEAIALILKAMGLNDAFLNSSVSVNKDSEGGKNEL